MVDHQQVTIYGNDTFCLVLAQILELKLVTVKDEDITKVKTQYLKRKVEIRKLSELRDIDFPKFIKPVLPKLFSAQVFQSQEDFNLKIKDIEASQQLICSEIILIEQEVRAFILNKEVADLAFYEGQGSIEGARKFLKDFLKTTSLDFPKTFVTDIGFNAQKGWFIIEFNSTWGAGLNYCNPSKVLNCIRAATIN